jgi:hypothetical protein
MAFLILLTVFIGFARTYYLAGIFQAPLPNRLIHIHGAVFTCWILLLITQTSLVSADRVDIHRRLGLFGFALACSMPVLAILAAIDEMVRHAGRANVLAFFAVPTFDILAFVPLIFFAWKYRSNAAAHKRLILLATIAILDAAVVRWPIHASWWGLHPAEWATEAFLIPLIAYGSFLHSQNPSRHVLGQPLVSPSPPHPRPCWAHLRLANLRRLGPARRPLTRP